VVFRTPELPVLQHRQCINFDEWNPCQPSALGGVDRVGVAYFDGKHQCSARTEQRDVQTNSARSDDVLHLCACHTHGLHAD